MTIPENLILDEFLRRQTVLFEVDKFCFDKQIAFIKDEAKFKTAVCSGRAGKTVACASDLTATALSQPGIICLYITLARTNGKKIVWPELLNLNREFNLGGNPNESDLSIRYPNGSIIYVSGAKDQTEIERFRGMPIKKCYIDEAQSFKAYIKKLIDEVISIRLFDYDGTLCLIGTPGPVPAGYFYECSVAKNWSHHAWTMFDNPHIQRKSGKTPHQLVQRELTRRGVTIDDASIQRECFGRWVTDNNSLVFKYNPLINHFDSTVSLNNAVIGVDLGFDDADAIAVLKWDEKTPNVYLVYEDVTRKQGITELATKLCKLIEEHNPLRVVMDTGALGKKIADEIRRRFSIPILAAEKQRKFEFIELLNDALRTEKFFAKKDGQFAQDSALVEWDRDVPDPSRPKIRDTFHSDICDAVLYAYRESLHWLFTPEVVPLIVNSPEWFLQIERELEQKALEELQVQKDSDLWNQWE